MRVAIRADASVKIGGGHVMRCLALAQELAQRGNHVAFLSSPGTTEIVSSLARSQFATIAVSSAPTRTLEAMDTLSPNGVDLLIVDNYGIGALEERMFRSRARTILVIDDLADRAHDCDLLLDQTLGREGSEYSVLVPASCRVFTGAKYALLRSEFSAVRPRALARRRDSGPVGRILISLGMTDIGGITESIVRGVLGAETNAALDIVLNGRARSRAEIAAVAGSVDDVHVHIDTEDMANLMLAADLAVGAAGSTSWERCCLGLPTVTVVLAENQQLIAANLARRGATINVANAAAPIEKCVGAAIARLASDHALRGAISKAAFGVTDGLGARRVAEAIMAICSQRNLSSVPP